VKRSPVVRITSSATTPRTAEKATDIIVKINIIAVFRMVTTPPLNAGGEKFPGYPA
jgi:hypothetical protein